MDATNPEDHTPEVDAGYVPPAVDKRTSTQDPLVVVAVSP
jgi:hypothetical protein